MVPTTALGHESGSRRRIDRALIDRALIDRALTDRALAEHGVACTVAQVVGHTTTIFRMLDAGLGLSVIPTLALPPEGLARLAVRPRCRAWTGRSCWCTGGTARSHRWRKRRGIW